MEIADFGPGEIEVKIISWGKIAEFRDLGTKQLLILDCSLPWCEFKNYITALLAG